MLVFISSLRHPQNSTSYEKIEKLLNRTLNSVCQQTDENFQVIIVCNQVPQQSYSHAKVEFVTANFPPPSPVKGTAITREAVLKDKGSKYFLGLLHAQKYHPNHVMFFDADDLVSNRLAQYINAQPNQGGWFINNGYIYGDSLGLIQDFPRFNEYCGTCNILNFQLLDIPEKYPENPSIDWILATAGDYYIQKLLGSHHYARSYFETLKAPLAALPFPGAVYVVDNGENHSGKKLWSLGGLAHPASNKVCDEFHLDRPKVKFELIKSIVLHYLLPKISRKMENLSLFQKTESA